MINGPCAGAGLSLAGACDLRFSARSAVFVSAFATAGVSGDFGGAWFWSRILGSAKARELYLLAERMTADEAQAFGLTHRVFEDADLSEQTLAIAERLAGRPPHVAGYIKENLNLALEVGLSRALDIEARNMLLSGRTWLTDEPTSPLSQL
jgi:2-(1,2-epoxy-1,2-dihydrophenyl)acetyl-CoA isomerase